MSQSMATNLTEGNVAGLLLRFAFPLFVSNALQAVYNIVDMIVVGQYIGGAGMSAVSIGGDILHLLTFVAMGFSSAGQVLIAQDVGGTRMDGVKQTIGTMFTVLLSASVLIAGICFFLRHPILVLLNTPAESYAYTLDYTVTCIAGLPFIYGYNTVSAILRGMGDSKRPFIFIAIAAVLNMILDVLFVVGFGMEVFGAALATAIGQGASFLVSLAYLYRRREAFGFDKESFIPQPATLKRLLALGIPMAIQSAAVSFSKIVLMAWINLYGVVFSALAGVYNKINTVVSVVSNSFTTAGSSMVGQNLGAGKYDRVPRILQTVLLCGAAIAVFLSGVILLFPDQVFILFTRDSMVLATASVLILPIVLNFFGSATRSWGFSLINGSGNTKLNLAVALIDGVMSRMGIAALLGYAMGMDCLGFWLGDALAGFMPFLIGACYFASGRWRASRKIS